jgi:hypothetical protein
MTSKELYATLEAAGWMFGSSLSDTGVSWYAYRRLIGGKNCICNDKPPSLTIQPHDQTFGEHNFKSVTFEIRGEIEGGRWIDFSVYGIKYDEVITEIPRCTAVLLAAWNAVASGDVE